MDLQWLDLPFTVLTLLLATRLAYDYCGVVAAAFAGGFSLQIFLFYCFARWYRHAIGARAGSDGGDDQPPHLPSSSARQEDGTPPVLTPLVETVGGEPASLANRCFPLVFMVLVPLVIVFFERSQADVVAYVLCLTNIIVMVVWLSPDSGSTVSAAKSFLRLSDDEDEGSGCSGSGGAVDKCCVCLGGLLEEQALRALPRCGHRFHDKCIVKWLKAHPTCPVCRATAVPPTNGDGGPLDDDISPV